MKITPPWLVAGAGLTPVWQVAGCWGPPAGKFKPMTGGLLDWVRERPWLPTGPIAMRVIWSRAGSEVAA